MEEINMLKTVKIGERSYDMKSSAFTPFKYENDYGRDLLKDLNELNKKNTEISKLKTEEERNSAWMNEINFIFKMSLQIAYVMICEQDPKFKAYDEWLKELDNAFGDPTWVQEVMELAMSTFRGRVQN
jgi:hypothetical protein